MKKDSISQKIQSIFLDTFSDLAAKDFSFDTVQADFANWDSFAHMELVSKIEQEFGITLEFSDIAEIDTPRKFVEAVEKKNA